MLYLVFLFIILFAYLSYRRLELAVFLVLAMLPSYLIRFQILGIPFTLLESMILTVSAVWFLNNKKTIIENIRYKLQAMPTGRQVTSYKLSNRYPFDIEIVLLLIISFIAVGVAGFSNEALGVWKAYFFEPVLFYIVLFNILITNTDKTNLLRIERSSLEKIFFALGISAFVVSVFAIYQKITGDFIFNPLWAAESTRRVTSFFGYPNAVGLFLGPLTLILIGFVSSVISSEAERSREIALTPFKRFLDFARNDNMKILFIFVTIIISLSSIYFAKSEGALIGIVAASVLFGLLVNKKMRLITLGLIIAGGILIGVNSSLRSYVIEKITLRDLSGEIRKQQWRETWQMMTESKVRFIFGTGLSGYQKAVAPYHVAGIFFNSDNDPEFHRHVVWNEEYKKAHWQPVEIYFYPHNILLNFWTELGIAGAILFIWIIVKFYILGFRLILNYELRITNYEYFILGLLSAMTVILTHGLVDVPYFKNDLSVMFWVIIALMGFVNLKFNSFVIPHTPAPGENKLIDDAESSIK